MKNQVMGQTGTIVLSDDMSQYRLGQGRIVRFQYMKIKYGFIAWVCGPFHSRTYGASSFGTTHKSAKVALQRNLANNYRYIGHVLFSCADEADKVGIVNTRLLDHNELARPITMQEACAGAGL